MSIRQYLLLPFLLFLATASAFGQVKDSVRWRGIPDKIGADTHRGPSRNALLDKGRKSFREQAYFEAMHYFQLVLEAYPTDSAALRGLGDAAFQYTRYNIAAGAYQKMLDSNLVKDNGELLSLLGDAYYGQGDYAEAQVRYQEVLSRANTAAALKGKAALGLKKCAWAVEHQKTIGFVRMDTTLPRNINTRYSEYAPLWADSLLYYASYGGYAAREDEKSPDRRLFKVLTADVQKDSAIIAPAPFNEEKKHTAYATFSTDKRVLYYAVAKKSGRDKPRFELFRRTRTALNDWGPAERLPDKINLKGYTATQPRIARLPGDTTETLFFVSDRPGGKGGRDIWYCRIEHDTFTSPENLNYLNREGDDVSPYFHAKTGNFYFSSNSYPEKCLGGFDIYRSAYANGIWAIPEPLPAPLNSGANDVFYTMTDDGQAGFFSSNRDGAMNFSEEDCCYDLFKALLTKPAPPRITLIADVFDADTKAPLSGTQGHFLTTAAIQGDGSLAKGPNDGPLDSVYTENLTGNRYAFDLDFDRYYHLHVSKAGYTSAFLDTSTVNMTVTDTIWVKLYLRRGLYLDVYVFDDLKKDPLNDVNLRLVEVFPDRDVLIATANTGLESNDWDTIIRYDSRYRIIATKADYSTDSLEFRTDVVSKEPFQRIRQDLFLRPLDPGRYLPIVLYFDNDQPDCCTRDTTTKKEYREAYLPYYRQKQAYVENYSFGVQGEEFNIRKFEMDTFFERQIKGEWDKMRFFSERLYEILQSGRHVNIVLKGYASPRGNQAYNYNLTTRRVKSVLNHFSIFDGGIYKPYFNSRQLRVTLEPYGASKAPQGVNATDKRLSIFSVAAARERRVEIIAVRVENPPSADQRQPQK